MAGQRLLLRQCSRPGAGTDRPAGSGVDDDVASAGHGALHGFGGREARLLLARYLDRIGTRGVQLGEDAYRQIGEFITDYQAERLLGQQVVALGERGESAAGEASMSKLHGPSDRPARRPVARRRSGADAYTLESGDALAEDAEHFLRASTVLSIIGGTSEIQRNIIAQRWLGLPRG